MGKPEGTWSPLEAAVAEADQLRALTIPDLSKATQEHPYSTGHWLESSDRDLSFEP